MELRVEERQESCSVVSKIVRLKIFRRVIEGASLQEGEIAGYDCSASSSTCESKCHYRLLLEDY
ncbi:hypothetical protein Desor_1831 [Desulfosporosinus orientis DSM 765]|uniref:Uncharacterized protein n=1 Tax=Desulfosporosinus orientis (strain ATCC 19365 / DSM 765 / NCIMB 8382 / VKM B-1628 / Singapore I) TaxID=768706 RepID=G7W8N9_DESOD|nr:hypothetical protein Desor_1831 [Desulfosporosinus orientis DSM 765]